MIRTIREHAAQFAATSVVVMVSMKPMTWATTRLPAMLPIPPTITTATAMMSGATHMPGWSCV